MNILPTMTLCLFTAFSHYITFFLLSKKSSPGIYYFVSYVVQSPHEGRAFHNLTLQLSSGFRNSRSVFSSVDDIIIDMLHVSTRETLEETLNFAVMQATLNGTTPPA